MKFKMLHTLISKIKLRLRLLEEILTVNITYPLKSKLLANEHQEIFPLFMIKCSYMF